MECVYNSIHSQLEPGIQYRKDWTAVQIKSTTYKFRPACQYLAGTLELPGAMYSYEPSDIKGGVINDILEGVVYGFRFLGPQEGHYSLRGLVHEAPPFKGLHDMYVLRHFNLN